MPYKAGERHRCEGVYVDGKVKCRLLASVQGTDGKWYCGHHKAQGLPKVMTTLAQDLTEDDVEWVVNSLGELGVRIAGKCFFLYKGQSLVYKPHNPLEDSGEPKWVRPVGKLEFGETQWPDRWLREGKREPRYTTPVTFHKGLSFGKPEDGAWQLLHKQDAPYVTQEMPDVIVKG